jgi:hypothetical protein
MSKSLWEITTELQQIEDQLMENGGEVTPELETALQISQTELSDKAGNYISLILKNEADAEIIDAEIKRLTALKKSRQNIAHQLKERLSGAMQYFEISKIQLPFAVISLRQSESVEVDDPLKLPVEYQRVKTTVEADKATLKAALKAGEQVWGASLKTNQNLQIK